jgi:hypothetical protein
MQIDCELSQCITLCALTAIGVIVGTIILDIIIYFAYSYFIVRRYYSSDLASLRDKSLARYGYYPPGSTGADWREIFPPVDENTKDVVLKSISVNDNWVWGISENNDVYVCKKPCDGSTEDAFWHTVPGKLQQISVNNNAVWGIMNTRVFGMATTTDKGQWAKTPARLTQVAIGSTGWVSGVGLETIVWECFPRGGCWKKWYKQQARNSVQVAVGQEYIWSRSANGTISYKLYTANGPWKQIETPAQMKYITAGLTDNLFGIAEDGTLYMKPKITSPWIAVKNAPKLKILSVNKEIYGVSVDGGIWEGTIPKQ